MKVARISARFLKSLASRQLRPNQKKVRYRMTFIVGLAWSAAGYCLWDQRCQPRPLRISEIARTSRRPPADKSGGAPPDLRARSTVARLHGIGSKAVDPLLSFISAAGANAAGRSTRHRRITYGRGPQSRRTAPA